MALRPLNSVAGFSTGDPAFTVIQANGDITTVNLTANGISNLGPVSNLVLTGGTNGQFLQTDGNGNLTFSTITINTSNINNGTSNVSIDSANGNVTVSVNGNANVATFTDTGAILESLTVNGESNLGDVTNVHITGGNLGQFLKTDGTGNLTWDDVGNITSNNAGPMPYYIGTGESYIINENKQGLYSQVITIDGEFVVDGMLIEISDTIQSNDNQVLFDFNGSATGNAGFEFQYWSGNLSVPGNINSSGNIIPSADDTYDLGRANARWRNGYFGGNTIYLDTATISVDANGFVVITNELGGKFVVEGTEETSTTEIENGNSNVKVYANGNVATTVSGVANVLVVTTAGANLNGNLTASGVKTDNLYYANGNPWDLSNPGGSNTQVQFNNNGDFGASANFTFNSSTNNLTVAGNLVTNTGAIYGNGIGLSDLAGANVTGAVAYATTANSVAGANVSGQVGNALVAGTVYTNAQPNITSVGTLTNLSVTGNGVIGGNLVVNGNLVYVNVEELAVEDPIITLNTGANGTPPIANSGKDVGTALYYYDTQARTAFMGWDTSNAEFAFGSQTSISSEIVTFTTLGNVRAQTFIGNVDAVTIAGNLTTATQSNITTVGTLGSLAVTANITAGNVGGANTISGNYLISNSGCVTIGVGTIAVGAGTAGIFNSSINDINLGLAANVNIGSTTGNTTVRGNLVANNNVTVTGNVSANLVTGTLTTNAQPNVTSVGTLTSLTVSGNASANNATANTVTTNSTISKRSNIAVTTDTIIDSFDATLYRTAKYVIKSENDNGYESLEVLLIHNNINSYITVYAAINDGGGNTVAITSGISSGNVELRATGLSTGTIVNLIGTYVPD